MDKPIVVVYRDQWLWHPCVWHCLTFLILIYRLAIEQWRRQLNFRQIAFILASTRHIQNIQYTSHLEWYDGHWPLTNDHGAQRLDMWRIFLDFVQATFPCMQTAFKWKVANFDRKELGTFGKDILELGNGHGMRHFRGWFCSGLKTNCVEYEDN